tara:strand:+ start:2899 stop:3096 length:198 start_codon:yes stop_codon:yes gene_type:complete
MRKFEECTKEELIKRLRKTQYHRTETGKKRTRIASSKYYHKNKDEILKRLREKYRETHPLKRIKV